MNHSEKIVEGFSELFGRGNPFRHPQPATVEDEKKAYKMRRSFTDFLPWLWPVSYNGHDYIQLDDGVSFGAVLNVSMVSTEAQEEEFLVDVRDAIQRVFSDAMVEHQDSPWGIQIFGYRDESALRHYIEDVRAYAKDCLKGRYDTLPDYSQHYFDDILAPHLKDLSQEGGLFRDPLTDAPWSGCKRQVVVCIYRKQHKKTRLRRRQTPLTEVDEQRVRLQASLSSAGLASTPMTGADFHDFLFRWFNPNPRLGQGDTEAFLAQCPYPSGEDKPADWTLADAVCSSDVRSDKERKYWYFDGQPHCVLTVAKLRHAPKIAQVSGEQSVGNKKYVALDKLPPGSKFVISMVILAQNHINNHLDRLEKASKSLTAEAILTRESIQKARHNIVRQNKVYPYQIAIYLKAESEDQLDQYQTEVESRMLNNNLEVIPPEFDDLQLDAYIRHLPMAYNPALDQSRLRKGLIYAQHAANLVPIYGRAQGSGNPGILFYNRGGETFTADPLSLKDRSKNGHMFFFGPTGAGKSASLAYLMMHAMAVHRPRIVVIEAGNSFGLLSQYFEHQGLSTWDIKLKPGCGTSLPPFNLALQLVDDQGHPLRFSPTDDDAGDHRVGNESTRDILGELTIVATMMVTGGEAGQTLSRAQVSLLQEVILQAAGQAKRAGKDQLLTSDVINALLTLADSRPTQAATIHDMVDAMKMFTRGFAGELFDQPGSPWPDDVDFTRVELGTLSGDGQFDKLAVAYIGIINSILSMAERNQRDGRPTILITDEAHIITTQPFLSSYLVLYIKLLGRRLGLWFWMATQNMADFKDDAVKMLDMFEWWLCLRMGKSELEQLERFKALSPDQRSMILDTRKVDKKYTEGVLLSDNVQGLFRNVPPGLPMALAQTEKEEKTERARLMAQHNISELEAAQLIADNMAATRRSTD